MDRPSVDMGAGPSGSVNRAPPTPRPAQCHAPCGARAAGGRLPAHVEGQAEEIRETLRLAVPIAFAQIAMMTMGLVDAALVGRVSEADLSAVSIGNALIFSMLCAPMGVTMAVEPLASQAVGAGDPMRAWNSLRAGIVACLLLTIPTVIAAALSPFLLRPLGVDPAVIPAATRFVIARLPSIPLWLLFMAAKAYLEACGITRPLLVGGWGANVVNFLVVGVLVFGDRALGWVGIPALGLPALGSLGAGIGTSVSGVVLAGIALGAAWRARPKGARLFADDQDELHATTRKLLRVGLPIGLQLLTEVGVFTLVTLLAGRLGARTAAAHQIAIGLASYTYMGVLGISSATAVRVGRAIGAREERGPRRAWLVGLGLVVLYMGSCGVCFLGFGRVLARIFTDEPHVIRSDRAPPAHRRRVPDLRRDPGRRRGRAARGRRHALRLVGQRRLPLVHRPAPGAALRLHARRGRGGDVVGAPLRARGGGRRALHPLLDDLGAPHRGGVGPSQSPPPGRRGIALTSPAPRPSIHRRAPARGSAGGRCTHVLARENAARRRRGRTVRPAMMRTASLHPGTSAAEDAPPRVALSTRGPVRRFLSFAGPGALIAVGYIDPGNWATDLAAGSRFSYALLSVVLVSSLMAMLLQALSVRLGIATGRDLAEGCRDAWPRSAPVLWVLAEIAIAATDLAEVLGSAIALELLFGVPIAAGVALTVLDVLVLLGLERRGLRRLEAGVVALVLFVAGCFAFELVLSRPDPAGVLAGYLPTPALLHDRGMLYVAVGILGATVMPHNLYLHSSLVQSRGFERTPAGKRDALGNATLDAVLSLGAAMVINSAILAIAAAVFHRAGRVEVAELGDAHRLLSPLLGTRYASTVFAVALLAAGQSAALTGTMAGQVVMSGFLRVRLRPWAPCRLLTRSVAMVPALGVALYAGERGTADLAGPVAGDPEPAAPLRGAASLAADGGPEADGRAGEPAVDDVAGVGVRGGDRGVERVPAGEDGEGRGVAARRSVDEEGEGRRPVAGRPLHGGAEAEEVAPAHREAGHAGVRHRGGAHGDPRDPAVGRVLPFIGGALDRPGPHQHFARGHGGDDREVGLVAPGDELLEHTGRLDDGRRLPRILEHHGPHPFLRRTRSSTSTRFLSSRASLAPLARLRARASADWRAARSVVVVASSATMLTNHGLLVIACTTCWAKTISRATTLGSFRAIRGILVAFMASILVSLEGRTHAGRGPTHSTADSGALASHDPRVLPSENLFGNRQFLSRRYALQSRATVGGFGRAGGSSLPPVGVGTSFLGFGILSSPVGSFGTARGSPLPPAEAPSAGVGARSQLVGARSHRSGPRSHGSGTFLSTRGSSRPARGSSVRPVGAPSHRVRARSWRARGAVALPVGSSFPACGRGAPTGWELRFHPSREARSQLMESSLPARGRSVLARAEVGPGVREARSPLGPGRGSVPHGLGSFPVPVEGGLLQRVWELSPLGVGATHLDVAAAPDYLSPRP